MSGITFDEYFISGREIQDKYQDADSLQMMPEDIVPNVQRPDIRNLFIYHNTLVDFRLYPNVENIYIYNKYNTGELSFEGLNPKVKRIFIKQCRHAEMPYLPDLKLLLYCSSMGEQFMILTKAYHQLKKSGFDWAQFYLKESRRIGWQREITEALEPSIDI